MGAGGRRPGPWWGRVWGAARGGAVGGAGQRAAIAAPRRSERSEGSSEPGPNRARPGGPTALHPAMPRPPNPRRPPPPFLLLLPLQLLLGAGECRRCGRTAGAGVGNARLWGPPPA